MSDYDFRSLNDKEFEIFCADLLGDVEERRFDRFKPGRDSGVDGRYFSADGKEIVLQCKHWANTETKQLIQRLQKDERPKLEKLKPQRYLLAVSNPLSRSDKKAIFRALTPYLLSEDDIFGKENLNDLLRARKHIERRHYKLWLHSSSVLGHIFNNAIFGRSAFSLDEIIRLSARYVVTTNHQNALSILENLGVVIVTGEPGVGKTTLADHLCLHYICDGFEYLKIADDIREAEAAFDADQKQIIYFDDFLGRNYLEALKGHEGGHVTNFIRRVASNKNKRLVLTSRSTILNQGKVLIDSLEHDNIRRNEYELKIQALTELDKAQILYNHIWHSELGPDYVEQLYIDRRYREVIAHRNFNPRLISYVTDATRLEQYPPEGYWNYIEESLTNPTQVWENPFIAQLDDFGRAIILLVVFNGHPINEHLLADAYHRYLALPENRSLNGRQEFLSNIRMLTGAFLNRSIEQNKPGAIDLFNPSIADFVLSRYAGDINTIRLGMLSLKTWMSVMTLRGLHRNHQLSATQTLSICESLLQHLVETGFNNVRISYVTVLCQTFIMCGGRSDDPTIPDAVRVIVKNTTDTVIREAFEVVEWALNKDVIAPEQARDFLFVSIEDAYSSDEVDSMVSLWGAIPETISGYAKVTDAVRHQVFVSMAENFDRFFPTEAAFSRIDEYGAYEKASGELAKLVEEKLDELGIPYSSDDVTEVVEAYDVVDGLDSYFQNSVDEGRSTWDGPSPLMFDEIDDLFDRSA